MKVNYAILDGSMVLNFDSQTISLNKSDHRYNLVLEAIKSGNLDDIPSLLDNTKVFSQFEGVTVKDEELFFDGKKMPHGLSKKIFEFAEEGIPFEPLIKFFKKLSENPSFNSRSMLYSFLEHNGHPITQDGNFIAYRGVTEDFKDCHTRTFDNSVGAICEMDRSDVDENPNHTCSAGLHVACHDYAKSFGRTTIEVEVNPKDVVAVPTDYNNTKMRTCKFEVVAVCQNERDELVYSGENQDNEESGREFKVGDYVTCQYEDGIFEVVSTCYESDYEIQDITGQIFEYNENDLEVY